MPEANVRKPSKQKRKSAEKNDARTPSAPEARSGDNKIIETLLKGSDEDRQSVLDGFPSLSEERKAILRENLKRAISEARTPSRSREYSGWLISALAQVAGNDNDAIDIVTQQIADRSQGKDWERYWALAQLYWTRGVKEAASRAKKAGASSDPSPLVRTLADAIIRRDNGDEMDLPIMLDDATAFEQLRALQVVTRPNQVPSLVDLLLSHPSADRAYEILLALTATDETTTVAAQRLAVVGQATRVVVTMMNVSRGAKAQVIQRFVRLLELFPRREIEAALSTAPQARGDFSSIAKELLTTLPGDSRGANQAPGAAATTLPAGAWRAELAYRAVLQRPTTFDLLESLSATQLSSVLQQAGLAAGDIAPDKLDELARSIGTGGPPNPLWLAWIKNVHAARLKD